MIKLLLPSATANVYFRADGFLLGPYGDLTSGEQISAPSANDVFEERKGIYGENAVTHHKVDADLTFVPIAMDMTPSPTVSDPDKLTVKTKNGSSTTLIDVESGYYLNSESSVRTYVSSGTPYWLNYKCVGKAPGPIMIYQVWAPKSNPFILGGTLAIWKYENVRNITSTGLVADRTQYLVSGTNGKNVGVDWSQKQPIESFLKLLPPTGYGTGSISAFNTAAYRPFSTTSLSPSGARGTIDLLVDSLLSDFKSSLSEISYGELAMKASEKVNGNSVNMIAFLRDLRDPKALIPKLKNLKKIKTHAGNYLGYKYGILPTISDLNHILEAFRKVKPYIDKNGFTTYSAGHSSSYQFGFITDSVSQQIKLAIANEDSLFDALASKLDDWGFLATMENLWDLIPYSFVLDWFVDIGGLLHKVDSRLRLARLNIRYVTMSRRATQSINLPLSSTFPYVGTVEKVQYHRWVSDQCPVPTLSVQTPFEVSGHWLEAGALIITRPKRKSRS